MLSYDSGQATFTATGATTDLDFVSTDAPSNAFGIVLDAVSVVPVFPAPGGVAADFTFGVPTPSPLILQPGGQTSTAIGLTTTGTAAPVSLTASVTPAAQGVSANLDAASVVSGGSAGLNLVAASNAVPGTYTATVTGHLGAQTHSVSVPVTVTQSAGIPGLVLAIPAVISGPDASFADTGAEADGLFLTGMVNGPANAHYSLSLRTSATCPNGVLGGGTSTPLATFKPTDGADPLVLTGRCRHGRDRLLRWSDPR